MRSRCPKSTGEHSPLDRYGYCEWCKQKVGSTRAMPSLNRWVSELWLAYDYYYNPEYDSN